MFLIALLAVPRLQGQIIGPPGPPRLEQDCRPLNLPKRAQSLDAVLDSAAFLSQLQTLEVPPSAEVIVSILTTGGGSAHVVESRANSALGAKVAERVLSAVRVSKKNPPAFRVHVQLGATSRAKLEAAILCAPVEVDGMSELRVPFQIRRVAAESAIQVRNVTESLRIGVSGRVLEVNLGSGTGYPDIDRGLREALLMERYRPALLDGRPVEVWLTGNRVELVR